MSLLALERVSRGYGRGAHERVVLREISLELDGGELLAVWGLRHSGRSTLLRVAAGVEAPDAGVVRFAGRELTDGGGELGEGIGYCRRALPEAEGNIVLDEMVVSLLARGVQSKQARTRARAVLARCGVERSATSRLRELNGAETVRIALARALALEPQLLVIDEPTEGVDLIERDGILALLRSLADDGLAVLMSTGDAMGLAGADRALSLAEGELRGSLRPELAAVLPLRRQASA